MITKSHICTQLNSKADQLFSKLSNSEQLLGVIFGEIDSLIGTMTETEDYLPDPDYLSSAMADAAGENAPDDALDVMQCAADKGILPLGPNEAKSAAENSMKDAMSDATEELTNDMDDETAQKTKDAMDKTNQLLSYFEQAEGYVPGEAVKTLGDIVDCLSNCDNPAYTTEDFNNKLTNMRLTKDGSLDMNQFDMSSDLKDKVDKVKKSKDESSSSVSDSISSTAKSML